MNFTPDWISFEDTHSFSSLAINYLEQNENLKPFYAHDVSPTGVADAIIARKKHPVNRAMLVSVLQRQYEQIDTSDKVKDNIQKLLSENTFTVTTAHQPNIFTGYLYFVYKILHVIRLAEELREAHPGKQFVPVYYMGSEDNDLEELNHIFLGGDTLTWHTEQKGAVGRMNTAGIEKLIEQINGQLGIYPFGAALKQLLLDSYKGTTIQEATLRLTNALFQQYGLVILIPDQPEFKQLMIPVFEDDIFHNTAYALVKETANTLAENYHAQVNPREINLFYMTDDLRERIVLENGIYKVNNTEIAFSATAIKEELQLHPERFSPNVVLRGLFQETLLPNIIFVGGGAEVAYWFELKKMFEHYGVPYPLIMLRNSFLILEEKATRLAKKLSLTKVDLFKSTEALLTELVHKSSVQQLTLQEEKNAIAGVYSKMEAVAKVVDITLTDHVKALHTRANNEIKTLEKKLLRAEKRKFEEEKKQIQQLRSILYPNNTLQERIENILPYYAKYGAEFIEMIYQHSPAFRQEFGILSEQ